MLFGKRAASIGVLAMLVLAGCGSAAAPSSPAGAAAAAPSVKANAASGAQSSGNAPAASPASSAAVKAAAARLPEVRGIKASLIQTSTQTAPWLAGKKGYFKDEGFNSVDFVQGNSNPELISLLTAGKIQFAISASFSTFLAVESGFDLVQVSNSDSSTDGTAGSDGRRDVFGLLVRNDSPIKRPKDLEGKKVAVSSDPSLVSLFDIADIRKDGGDDKKVTFVQIPFQNMSDALLNGTVDAASALEPWTALILGSGKARAIAYPYVDVIPGQEMSTGGYVTTRKFAEANPLTVAKFVNAIQRGQDDLNADEAFARTQMAQFSGLDPAVVAKMWLPPMSTQVNLPTLQKMVDLMVQTGMLKQPVDPAKIVWPTALSFCLATDCYYPPGKGPSDHSKGVTRRT